MNVLCLVIGHAWHWRAAMRMQFCWRCGRLA
jgi:hypothetical protein